jgi:hypothetical protein
MSRTLSAILPDSPQIIHGVAQQLLCFSPPGFQEDLASAETSSAKLGQDFMTVGWESFVTGADMSCVFLLYYVPKFKSREPWNGFWGWVQREMEAVQETETRGDSSPST